MQLGRGARGEEALSWRAQEISGEFKVRVEEVIALHSAQHYLVHPPTKLTFFSKTVGSVGRTLVVTCSAPAARVSLSTVQCVCA